MLYLLATGKYSYQKPIFAMKTMEPEVFPYFISDCLEVRPCEQLDLLSATWLRHPTSTEFRENNNRLADLLLARRSRKLLYDARAVLKTP